MTLKGYELIYMKVPDRRKSLTVLNTALGHRKLRISIGRRLRHSDGMERICGHYGCKYDAPNYWASVVHRRECHGDDQFFLDSVNVVMEYQIEEFVTVMEKLSVELSFKEFDPGAVDLNKSVIDYTTYIDIGPQHLRLSHEALICFCREGQCRHTEESYELIPLSTERSACLLTGLMPDDAVWEEMMAFNRVRRTAEFQRLKGFEKYRDLKLSEDPGGGG